MPLAGFINHQSCNKTCTTDFLSPKKKQTNKQANKYTYRFEEWGRDDRVFAGLGYRVYMLQYRFGWCIWVWSFSRVRVCSCLHHCLWLQNGGKAMATNLYWLTLMGNRVELGYLFEEFGSWALIKSIGGFKMGFWLYWVGHSPTQLIQKWYEIANQSDCIKKKKVLCTSFAFSF